MCNQFTFITNSGLILGGQHLSKRQTVFFTSVDPINKEHKDPNNIDLEAPRLVQAENVEETSKHGVLGRHKTCSTGRISVLSNKIERNHPLRHTPGVVSFSMYSCSHFKSFLLVPCRNEDRTRPRTMAHRGQKQDLLIW